ncbi:keratin-associated protein 5-3-like [Ruditapes philippinarum]|uniref:keratin-associated protein 5-3-like n=1 Tax=Ruditapes philippinarum TaxID=129788 RepID=UPI00295B5EFC|nr:keratin-associated protein 5-3-like [Ruditapes philippinarum]
MEVTVKAFLVCLFSVLTVSVLGQDGEYSRQRRPRPDLPGANRCRWGSAGVCGGFVNAGCPPGSYCNRNVWPTQTAGLCCRDRPDVERRCPFGQRGVCGTIAGRQCGPGTRCMFMGNFPDAGGKCCIIRPRPNEGRCPPSSGLAGICLFDPNRNCLSDRECRRGQLCCSEGCGSVCKNAIYGPDPVQY